MISFKQVSYMCGALIAMVLPAACSDPIPPADMQNAEDHIGEVPTVSSLDLISAFEGSPEMASQAYGANTLELTGFIVRVIPGNPDIAVIAAPSHKLEIYAEIPKGDQSTGLRANVVTSLICKKVSYQIDHIEVTGCVPHFFG